ncbi:MAG: teichoic acid ABC transporter permease [Epulopiscium sp. Nele67-Bin004]|nr:MAG: teichoic acid ABC transporter permease [Epulopiscium sp. Nele67-Bin004]
MKIAALVVINIGLIVIAIKRRPILELGREIASSRELIWNLSKNDFKTKYAGSYLGITWAFIQPVVSIMVYWFVFQVGFRSAPVEDFPFVLWLISGLVPWFFFQEALMNVTNSFIEYSYLVKKVVFKISILPIVKMMSALFVHLFFILFAITVFIANGYYPDFYTLQVFYYMACLFILILGIGYSTSAIILFFKDLGQIISIFLQIGMWMTPIMWSFDMIPDKFQIIFKLNPMFYIVDGYRNSLINKIWFWQNIGMTIYFWGVTIFLFVLGTLVFKKLKIHFADVL